MRPQLVLEIRRQDAVDLCYEYVFLFIANNVLVDKRRSSSRAEHMDGVIYADN